MRDTIAAIATPPGSGGVGIVRVSGTGALGVVRRLAPGLPARLTSHQLRRARVCDLRGEVLDDALIVWMQGPRSYTGEDVVEIQGHGGAAQMARLLGAVCEAGARLAAPGEFTQRAFLHGRLDLTQAEAVADLIYASSEAALRVARRHLEGELGAAIQAIQGGLITALMLTEAAIDFSAEEHVYQLDHAGLIARVEREIAAVEGLLGTWEAGRQAREGVRVVILGRPNAGKSTLFNLLCGQERAIVTEVAGTTRDVLEEVILVRGVAVRLADTAGLREATDRVERIGVERAAAAARGADLILWVIDGSDPEGLDGEVQAHLRASGAEVLAVVNKADRGCALALEGLGEQLHVSLASRQGEAALLDALATRVLARTAAAQGEGAVITRQRHRDALARALEAMCRARDAAEAGLSHEFIALDLRLALEATGEVVGRVSADDILNRIFADFCVGK